MTGQRAQGARSQMGLAFESAYGSSPASGFARVPFVSTTLGGEQNLLDNEVLGFGRDPLEPARDALNADGTIVVPMDVRNWGFWLKATFGDPITDGFTGAVGRFTFTDQPTVGSQIVLNGVAFTFVASGATGNQSNIGVSLAATLTALAGVLNASADAAVAAATYTADATHLIVTSDVLGTVGNDFTLASGVELLTDWNTPRAGSWSNQGNTGANSGATLGTDFVAAYALDSATGGFRITGFEDVTAGSVVRVRAWFKATGKVLVAARAKPGNVDSVINGPLGEPAAIASAAGVVSNIVATDLGNDDWLYQFDLLVGAGLNELAVRIGAGGAPAHAVTIYGASMLPPSVATADAALIGGSNAHVYQSGNWNLPSMSIETQMPEVPKYALYPGCVVDSLAWEMKRGGLLQATIKLIAQGENIDAETAIGDLTSFEYERFGHWNGSVKREGVAIGNVMQARINYMNNLDRIDAIRADGLIDGADPSITACKGQLVVRFANTMLLDQAIAGTPCELTFAHVISATKTFTFTIHAVYLPRPRTEISGPGGIEVTFDWQGAQTEEGGPMVTATLINDVAGY